MGSPNSNSGSGSVYGSLERPYLEYLSHPQVAEEEEEEDGDDDEEVEIEQEVVGRVFAISIVCLHYSRSELN